MAFLTSESETNFNDIVYRRRSTNNLHGGGYNRRELELLLRLNQARKENEKSKFKSLESELNGVFNNERDFLEELQFDKQQDPDLEVDFETLVNDILDQRTNLLKNIQGFSVKARNLKRVLYLKNMFKSKVLEMNQKVFRMMDDLIDKSVRSKNRVTDFISQIRQKERLKNFQDQMLRGNRANFQLKPKPNPRNSTRLVSRYPSREPASSRTRISRFKGNRGRKKIRIIKFAHRRIRTEGDYDDHSPDTIEDQNQSDEIFDPEGLEPQVKRNYSLGRLKKSFPNVGASKHGSPRSIHKAGLVLPDLGSNHKNSKKLKRRRNTTTLSKIDRRFLP